MHLKWGKGHISLYAIIKVRAPTIPLSLVTTTVPSTSHNTATTGTPTGWLAARTHTTTAQPPRVLEPKADEPRV